MDSWTSSCWFISEISCVDLDFSYYNAITSIFCWSRFWLLIVALLASSFEVWVVAGILNVTMWCFAPSPGSIRATQHSPSMETAADLNPNSHIVFPFGGRKAPHIPLYELLAENQRARAPSSKRWACFLCDEFFLWARELHSHVEKHHERLHDLFLGGQFPWVETCSQCRKWTFYWIYSPPLHHNG